MKLVFTDVNDELPSFKGVALNEAVIGYDDPVATFDESKFVVSENTVTIDLSGVHLVPGQSIDFSILG
ncbi:hypothetical protein D3C76_1838320 [compost metagenome]